VLEREAGVTFGNEREANVTFGAAWAAPSVLVARDPCT
jgi:hypothetical protein